MTTLNTQLKRVAGLAGTNTLTDWEERFVANLLAKTKNGDDTSSLSEAQITRLEEIHDKHFSG